MGNINKQELSDKYLDSLADKWWSLKAIPNNEAAVQCARDNLAAAAYERYFKPFHEVIEVRSINEMMADVDSEEDQLEVEDSVDDTAHGDSDEQKDIKTDEEDFFVYDEPSHGHVRIYKNDKEYNDIVYETALKVFTDCLEKYDHERGSFSHFMSFKMAHRRILADASRVYDEKRHIKKKRGYVDNPNEVRAFDQKYNINRYETLEYKTEDGEDYYRQDIYDDFDFDEQLESEGKLEKGIEKHRDETYLDILAAVISLQEKIGKKTSEDLLWDKIIFTEYTTIRGKGRVLLDMHERDIFRACNSDYFDYYMDGKVDSIKSLIETPFKPYGEVVPTCSEGEKYDTNWLKLHEKDKTFPADVSAYYVFWHLGGEMFQLSKHRNNVTYRRQKFGDYCLKYGVNL